MSFLFLIESYAQDNMRNKIFTYVCGNSGRGDEYNPELQARNPVAQDILLILNQKPCTLDEISKRITTDLSQITSIMSDLLRVNVIRKEGDKYFINFTLLTKEDQIIFSDTGRKFGRMLSNEIIKQENNIYSITDDIKSAEYMSK